MLENQTERGIICKR